MTTWPSEPASDHAAAAGAPAANMWTPPAPSDLPEIDVVIPVYRPGPWLDACLDSVLASEGVRARVWVVDDLPGDVRVHQAARVRDGVRLIVSPRNLRYAASVNLGIAAGSCEYVLLLNQDARVDRSCLALMARWFAEDRSLGSVGCRVLHQPSPDQPPDGLLDTVGIEMRRGRRAVDIGQGEADDSRWRGRRRVFGVCAAVVLYRRDSLERVARGREVMDPRFVMHKEDVDLAWRLQRAGFSAGVDGDGVAFHARGTARAADSATNEGAPMAGRVRAILRQERQKSKMVRRLAWRNHLLLIIKNETAVGLRAQFRAIMALQLGYLATGLLLDPWGTIAARLAAVGPLVTAVADRRSWPPETAVDISQWLE